MSTLAGQAAHYAEVRAKLNGKPVRKTTAAVNDIKARRMRVRDFLFVASPPVDRENYPHWKIILEQVALKHGISVVDIQSHRRDKPAYVARQEAVWRMRRETKMTTTQIGHRLGGRDHTTIMHAIKRHEQRLIDGLVTTAKTTSTDTFTHISEPVAKIISRLKVGA